MATWDKDSSVSVIRIVINFNGFIFYLSLLGPAPFPHGGTGSKNNFSKVTANPLPRSSVPGLEQG
jgi:hypothetical protein